MASFMLMEPANQGFQALIGNGIKFQAPSFQHDYAGERQQREDLWADIETIAGQRFHCLDGVKLLFIG